MNALLSSLLVDRSIAFLDTMGNTVTSDVAAHVPGAFPGKIINKRNKIEMTKKLYPSDVLTQAQTVLSAWNQISTTLAFGTLTATTLTADITQATTLESQIATLEAQLTNARNQRDALYLGMWDKLKRVRSGVKANYGDDSSQYEMVGGTRLSERKSPTRKVALPTAEPA